MSRYFDWTASLKRFVRFDAARSEDVNGAFDELTAGLDTLDTDVNRAIKLPAGTADQTLAMGAGQRAGLLLSFDASGNVTAVAGGGRYRGDWVAGTAYVTSDYFRDPASKNIYSTVAAHTSGVLATDITAGRVRLAINVADVEAAKAVAQASAEAATTKAGEASTKAGEASTSAASAASSAAAALASKNAAATSAADAEASRIAASKLNLGNKAAPPTVDNQGAALLAGATYYDTTLNKWRVWTGADWGDGISAMAGVTSVNGQTGNLTGFVTDTGVQTMANKTLTDPKITLGGTNGAAGQVPVSQGAGLPPVWGSVSTNAVKPASGGGQLTGTDSIFSIIDGGNYTLPDFSGKPGFSIASAANAVALPSEVTTSDGWKITTGFSVGTTKLLTPLDTTTAHGFWGASVTVTPSEVASISLTPAFSSPSFGNIRGSAALDSNRTLLIIAPNLTATYTNWVVVYDKTSDTFGAPVALPSAATIAGLITVFALTNNSFVLARPLGGVSAEIIAGTVSGTTITLGSAYNPAKALTQSTRTSIPPIMIKLSSSLVLLMRDEPTGTKSVQAISISGSTLTPGAAVNVGSCYGPRMLKHSATAAILSYQTSSTNNANTGIVQIVSVSGTTITLGGTVSTDSNLAGDDNNFVFDTFVEGQSYLWAAKQYGTNSTNFKCITVSGTTCTVNSATNSASLAPSLGTSSRALTWELLSASGGITPNSMPIDSSTILVDLGGIRTVTLSGTTVSLNSPLNPATYGSILCNDFAGNLYVTGGSPLSVNRIAVSSGSISVLESVAVSALPHVIPSSTKNSRAIKYNTLWFAWSLSESVIGAVSADKWLRVPSTNLSKLVTIGPMQ